MVVKEQPFGAFGVWKGDAACRGIRIQKQGAGAQLSKEALVLSRGAVSCAGGCRDSHSGEADGVAAWQRGGVAAWRPDGDAGAGAGRAGWCWQVLAGAGSGRGGGVCGGGDWRPLWVQRQRRHAGRLLPGRRLSQLR
jgi:hypothetical protein